MIMRPVLYVNGDSHTAAAEAVNPCGFAQDDHRHHIKTLGRQPHPDNLAVSWGRKLADLLEYDLVCDAESASSNARIIRTTREYLTKNTPDLVVIGWSTWEREEWQHDGIWWQVNAGGMGSDWPQAIKHRYRDYVLNIDWSVYQVRAYLDIVSFHVFLKSLNVPHVFFNTFNDFSTLRPESPYADLISHYVEPYDPNHTFHNWCRSQGFRPVNAQSYHFGPDAHAAWADYVYKFLIQSILTR
jgi:hypothetical protein